MLNDKKIGFIGSGNMGEAMISGLIDSGTSRPENIMCSDIQEDKLREISAKFGVHTSTSNIEVATASDIVILAIKPQIMVPVLQEIKDCLDMTKIIISIAAGVPLTAIETCLNKDLRLIRVMPNVAVSVREGAAAIAAGDHTHKEDVDLAMAIFNSVGKSIFLKENNLMDAVTGLSGSGPAYIFMIVDALADAGVRVGLARKDALLLASQTILGAAKMLIETGEHPGALKDSVTSPGGTAIAGLHTLEMGGLRTTLINAVQAATQRSVELGEMMIKHFAENGEKPR